MAQTKEIDQKRSETQKKSDIEVLEKISQLIKDLIQKVPQNDESNQVKFRRNIVNEISDLGKKISFYDDDPETIRNKYGHVDRSNNNAKREGGIHFTYLKPLRYIDDKDLNSPELISDLKVTAEKIDLVIKNETTLSTNDITAFKSNNAIVNLVGQYYLPKLINSFKKYLNEFKAETLDFNKREDRYHFANMLLIAGDLSIEMINFSRQEEESGLFRFFKKIRDRRAAHDLNLMVSAPSEKKIEAFNAIHDLLRQGLINTINKIKIEDSSSTDIGHLSDEQKSCLDKVFNNAFKQKDNELDREIISRIENNFGERKQQKQQGQQGNKQDNKTAPPRIIRAIQDSESIVNNLNLKFEKLDKATKKKKDIIRKEIISLVQEFNALLKIKGLEEITIEENPTRDSTFDKIKKLHEKNDFSNEIIQLKRQRDEELKEKTKANADNSKDKKEEEANASQPFKNHSSDIKSVTASIKTKIKNLLGIAEKETLFVVEVINNDSIEEEKKCHILRFCQAKIGQSFRDIATQYGNSSIYQDLMKYPLIHDSILRVIESRNKGVAHEVLEYDKQKFLNAIAHETNAIKLDLGRIICMLDYDEQKISKQDSSTAITSYRNLYESYLGVDKVKAKSFLQKAIKRYNKDNKEAQNNNIKISLASDSLGFYTFYGISDKKNFLKYLKILEDNVEGIRASDLTQYVIGILNVAAAYEELGDYNKSIEILEKFISDSSIDEQAKDMASSALIRVTAKTQRPILNNINNIMVRNTKGMSPMARFDYLLSQFRIYDQQNDLDNKWESLKEARKILCKYESLFRSNITTPIYFDKRKDVFSNIVGSIHKDKQVLDLKEINSLFDDFQEINKNLPQKKVIPHFAESLVKSMILVAENVTHHNTSFDDLKRRETLHKNMISVVHEYKFPLPLTEIYIELSEINFNLFMLKKESNTIINYRQDSLSLLHQAKQEEKKQKTPSEEVISEIDNRIKKYHSLFAQKDNTQQNQSNLSTVIQATHTQRQQQHGLQNQETINLDNSLAQKEKSTNKKKEPQYDKETIQNLLEQILNGNHLDLDRTMILELFDILDSLNQKKVITNDGRGYRCGYYALAAGIYQLTPDQRTAIHHHPNLNLSQEELNQLQDLDIHNYQYALGDMIFARVEDGRIAQTEVNNHLQNFRNDLMLHGSTIEDAMSWFQEQQQVVSATTFINCQLLTTIGQSIGVQVVYNDGEINDGLPAVIINNTSGVHYEARIQNSTPSKEENNATTKSNLPDTSRFADSSSLDSQMESARK